jgi:hypothetical protein
LLAEKIMLSTDTLGNDMKRIELANYNEKAEIVKHPVIP